MGILKDVPVQVGKFIIPCDFIVLYMDTNFQAPLILGRPLLATARAVIDVPAGTMSFQLCEERVDFYFPQPTPSLLPATPSPPAVPVHTVPLDVAPGITVFDGDEGPRIWPTILHDVHLSIPTSLGITSVCTWEVLDLTLPVHTSTSTPLVSSPFTNWR